MMLYKKKMKEVQLFLFTSISEDTSTVVLEAISNQLPVLCFDACGFGAVIDDQVGRKITLSDPNTSANNFAKELNDLENNRQVLKEMSTSCKDKQVELSWDQKAIKVEQIYRTLI